MKKFFTSISLQGTDLDKLLYRAVGNHLLQMEEGVSYPILTAVNGYAVPGEEFRVIAVQPDMDAARRNAQVLSGQLNELCARKGLLCPKGLEVVQIENDQRVSSHIDTFQKLLSYVDDGDELFCCITFGTKPQSQAVLLAVQYAYRVKQNASISCIVYGDPDRSQRPPVRGFVYDVTALTQLDEIVHRLAAQGVQNPKAVLETIFAL
ncbi:MAG: hypothetical protein HDT27_07430 [Subdoligranulum sp.]|nr:hypothetical protein [Subdoligranulum sp.]